MVRTITDVPFPLWPALEELCLTADVEVVAEYRFHVNRRWRFDAAIPEKMIAIEYEGGVFKNGRHVRALGFLADAEKYNRAAMDGWRVLRYGAGKAEAARFIAELREVLMI